MAAVLSVRVSCPNGNKAGSLDKVVNKVKGVNKTTNCQLEDALASEISNLPDDAFALVVRYRFGNRVPSKCFFNRILLGLRKY